MPDDRDHYTFEEVTEQISTLREYNRMLREEFDDFLEYLGVSKMEYMSYKQTGRLRLHVLAEDKAPALAKELASTRQELLDTQEERDDLQKRLDGFQDELDELHDECEGAVEECEFEYLSSE